MVASWTPPWRREIRQAEAAAEDAAQRKHRAYRRAGIVRDLGHRLAHSRERNGFTEDARAMGFGVHHSGKESA